MPNDRTKRAGAPAGVPTTPEPGRAYVPLKKAAERAGCDRRTMQKAVMAAMETGVAAGFVRETSHSVRWFVYEDAVPGSPTLANLDQLDARVQRLELATAIAADQQALETADLRAHLVAATETNLLLMEANELLAAAHKAADEDRLRSQESHSRQAELLRQASSRYAQALSLTMTPGHAGQLTAAPDSGGSH